MSQENVGSQVISKTSRRRFLKEAASFTAAAPRLSRAGQTRTARRPRRVLAYVGTYSLKEGPADYVGNGQGICLFEMNPATGALSLRETFADSPSPAWLAFDPSRTHLYSANETITFKGADSGSVSSYSIDRRPAAPDPAQHRQLRGGRTVAHERPSFRQVCAGGKLHGGNGGRARHPRRWRVGARYRCVSRPGHGRPPSRIQRAAGEFRHQRARAAPRPHGAVGSVGPLRLRL